ncbi:MAG: PEP-CTERM sorting domain-containing protein [Planctomycetota bacterium]
MQLARRGKKHEAAAAAVALAFASFGGFQADASLIQTFGPVTLETLGAGSFTVGDKTFSNFGLVSLSTGGALASTDDSITVAGGFVDGDPNQVYLDFQLSSLTAASGQTSNVGLSFQVDVNDPLLGVGLVSLTIAAPAVTGNGIASVGESVYNGTDIFDPVVANLNTTYDGTDFGVLQQQSVIDPPSQQFFVVKDLNVSGGVEGSAKISRVFQLYDQVVIPEPGTLLLVLAGVPVLAQRRRR